MSTLSAWVGGQLFVLLAKSADAEGGMVFPQDSALHIWPERPPHFRKPDAMYYAAGLLANPFPNPLDVAPSIVVEVIAPDESGTRIELKAREYLGAGVRLVWVIYPETRSIHILVPADRWHISGWTTRSSAKMCFPSLPRASRTCSHLAAAWSDDAPAEGRRGTGYFQSHNQ